MNRTSAINYCITYAFMFITTKSKKRKTKKTKILKKKLKLKPTQKNDEKTNKLRQKIIKNIKKYNEKKVLYFKES